ncbi:hypothetical protein LVY75_05210 (plasmid) [Sinorhizobium sp. B11]
MGFSARISDGELVFSALVDGVMTEFGSGEIGFQKAFAHIRREQNQMFEKAENQQRMLIAAGVKILEKHFFDNEKLLKALLGERELDLNQADDGKYSFSIREGLHVPVFVTDSLSDIIDHLRLPVERPRPGLDPQR